MNRNTLVAALFVILCLATFVAAPSASQWKQALYGPLASGQESSLVAARR